MVRGEGHCRPSTMTATGHLSICAISLAYCRPGSKGEDSPRHLDLSLSGLGWQTSAMGVRMPQMLLSQRIGLEAVSRGRTGFFQLTPVSRPTAVSSCLSVCEYLGVGSIPWQPLQHSSEGPLIS